MATVIAYMVFIGTAIGFAILWRRSDRAHAAVKKAVLDSLGTTTFQVDALRKKIERDMEAMKGEILIKLREAPSSDEDEATKVMSSTLTPITPTVRSNRGS